MRDSESTTAIPTCSAHDRAPSPTKILSVQGQQNVSMDNGFQPARKQYIKDLKFRDKLTRVALVPTSYSIHFVSGTDFLPH